MDATPANRKRKKIRLPPDAYHRPGAWYFVTICCRDKRSRLKHPSARDIVVEVLRETAAAERVELAAYSVLPNHLHVICSAGTSGLVGFIRQFKGRAVQRLRRLGEKRSPWQASFFDRKLRNEESLRQKCEYVWMNPVRRGLARNAQEYRWNGAMLTT